MHTSLPDSGFSSLGLSQNLLTVLEKAHFTTPTPIQGKSIPVALTGQDVVGIAETGTGKTLAFSLPILEKLIKQTQERALIIVPTRELALQVEESIRFITHFLPFGIRAISLIGGAPMYRQIQNLKKNPRIIVATPGRLRDHLEQGTVNLDRITTLVLDEADRMLDMGFLPQIKFICASLPAGRQTLLFSATFAGEIAKLSGSFLTNPVRVEVAKEGTSSKQIQQSVHYVPSDQKLDKLHELLNEHQGTVLVFSRTKHGARKLTQKIVERGHTSTDIHSNKSLSQRRQALDGFKSGRYRILVATDVASRGIDVKNIQAVINYDLPDAKEDYVHRIGRTGRAGKTGVAVSLATPDQKFQVKAIERLIGQSIPASGEVPTQPISESKTFRPRNNSWRPARPTGNPQRRNNFRRRPAR